MSTHLSDHFSIHELFPYGPEPTKMELYLARRLCEERLEVLREIAGQPLNVTDGRRMWRDHIEYAKRRLKPSPTSDHAYGEGFLQTAGDANQHAIGRRFAADWFAGFGAADVKPMKDGHRRNWTREEFDQARVTLADPLSPKVRQLIYYESLGHIHVSNPVSVLYGPSVAAALGIPVRKLAYVKAA